MSYYTIGQIKYNPTTLGNHVAMIFIKNNSTILYPMILKGQSKTGLIEVISVQNHLQNTIKFIKVNPIEQIMLRENSQTILEFSLSKEDLAVPIDKLKLEDNNEVRRRKTHTRIFTIKNVGDMSLNIKSISVDYRGCSAYGIDIITCGNFSLDPHKEYNITIKYTTSFAISSIQRQIVFFTEAGHLTFEL